MKPHLYLMCGLPCSGKTTFAKQLAKTIGADLFSSDEWIIKKYDSEFLTEAFYERHTEARNDISLAAEASIKEGRSAILDFGFHSHKRRENIEKKENCGVQRSSSIIWMFQ